MSLTKKEISKEISSNLEISNQEGLKFLEAFLQNVKIMSTNNLKISNFGVFYKKITKKRIGRNPKTNQEYVIEPASKIIFRPSNFVKKYIN